MKYDFFINDSSNIVGFLPPSCLVDPNEQHQERIKRSRFFLENEEGEILNEYLEKSRLCQFCGKRFKEIDNLGKLQCRAHFGVPSMYRNEQGRVCEIMTCCGIQVLDRAILSTGEILDENARVLGQGCIPMDHNFEPHIFENIDDIQINKQISSRYLGKMGLDLPDVINSTESADDSEIALIRRYDEITLRYFNKKWPTKKEILEIGVSRYYNGFSSGFCSKYQKDFSFFEDQIEKAKRNKEAILKNLDKLKKKWERKRELEESKKNRFTIEDPIYSKMATDLGIDQAQDNFEEEQLRDTPGLIKKNKEKKLFGDDKKKSLIDALTMRNKRTKKFKKEDNSEDDSTKTSDESFSSIMKRYSSKTKDDEKEDKSRSDEKEEEEEEEEINNSYDGDFFLG